LPFVYLVRFLRPSHRRALSPADPHLMLKRIRQSWLDCPLQLKGAAVAAIPVMCLAAMLVGIAILQGEHAAAQGQLLRSQSVRLEAERLLAATVSAETGVRGFDITAEEAFLEPYASALRMLPQSYSRLTQLARGERRQMVRLRRLRYLGERRLEMLAANIRITRAEGNVGRRSAALVGPMREGRRRMDEFRSEVGEFLAAEQHHLDAHLSRVRHLEGIVTLSLWVSLLLGVVGGLAAGGLLNFGITRRLDILRDNAERVAAELPLRVLPASSDEIGRLDQGLRRMAEVIHEREASLEEGRRAFEELSARNLAIVNTAAEGILTITAQGVVESLNPAGERLFGWPRHEVIGSSIRRFIPGLFSPDQEPDAGHALSALISGGSEIQTQGRRRDGNCFPLEVTLSEMWLGRQRLFVALLRDITERKRVEEALAMARDRALEASRAKSTFLANVSHELRTPLNAIIGYSELLQEELQDAGHEGWVADARRVRGSGKHLLALINNVLDLSKIEAGSMEVQVDRFAVEEVVHEALGMVEPQVARSGSRLKVGDLGRAGTMQTDRVKLRQCLFNLLSNAARFTTEGTICVEVTRERRSVGDCVLFRVSDTGVGMSPDQMSRLFCDVHESASMMGAADGIGLGLALTRSFCRMMGGDIAVDSTVGRGSIFTITLPAGTGPAGNSDFEHASAPVPVPAPLTPDLRGKTVLVIDDDPAVHVVMRRFLEKDGFVVETSFGGPEGLRRAREINPAVITLATAPEVDGWSILAAIKQDPLLADTPVVMLTMGDEETEGKAAGAVEYLTKPVDRRRLMRLVQRYSSAAAKTGEASPGTVLVVEDDRATRHLLRGFLTSSGWQVLEAGDGHAALTTLRQLARARKTLPHLVLLDLMMPEMDGFELAAAVRKDPVLASIPVVVLTALELTDRDHERLHGLVTSVLSKGAETRQELLREVSGLVAAAAAPSHR